MPVLDFLIFARVGSVVVRRVVLRVVPRVVLRVVLCFELWATLREFENPCGIHSLSCILIQYS